MRQNVGVSVLAASLVYSALDLVGWLRPMFLRMRANAGPRHALALVVGSLTFKATLLIGGIVLAFWPVRRRSKA